MFAKEALGIESAHFDHMHIDNINAMNKSVHFLYTMVPGLRGNIIGIKVGLLTPGLMAAVKKSTATGKHLFVANSHYFMDASKIQKQMKKNEETKFHPKGACNADGVFNHEMGHILCSHFGTSKTHEIFHLFNELTPVEIRQHLSAYACTDRHEFVSEAWSEYTTSSSPRPLAKLIGKLVEAQAKGVVKSGKPPGPGQSENQYEAAKREAKKWYGDVVAKIRGIK